MENFEKTLELFELKYGKVKEDLKPVLELLYSMDFSQLNLAENALKARIGVIQ